MNVIKSYKKTEYFYIFNTIFIKKSLSFDNNENNNDFSIDKTPFKQKKTLKTSRSQQVRNQSIIDINNLSISIFSFSSLINFSTTNFRRQINEVININDMLNQQLNSII